MAQALRIDGEGTTVGIACIKGVWVARIRYSNQSGFQFKRGFKYPEQVMKLFDDIYRRGYFYPDLWQRRDFPPAGWETEGNNPQPLVETPHEKEESYVDAYE